MGMMRFTIVDDQSTVSFIGPDRALQALVAACSADPHTIDDLLERVAPAVGGLFRRREPVVIGEAHAGTIARRLRVTSPKREHALWLESRYLRFRT